jgi:HSP20 family protein
MRLTVWDPFREMAALQRAMNTHLFTPLAQRRSSYPPVQVVDKGETVVVKAEIPGLDKDDIELTVLGNTLTIAGEKKLVSGEGLNYIRHERPHGRFQRLLDMPYSVERDNISASYKDGILTVTMPKAEEAKPKKLSVE